MWTWTWTITVNEFMECMCWYCADCTDDRLIVSTRSTQQLCQRDSVIQLTVFSLNCSMGGVWGCIACYDYMRCNNQRIDTIIQYCTGGVVSSFVAERKSTSGFPWMVYVDDNGQQERTPCRHRWSEIIDIDIGRQRSIGWVKIEMRREARVIGIGRLPYETIISTWAMGVRYSESISTTLSLINCVIIYRLHPMICW